MSKTNKILLWFAGAYLLLWAATYSLGCPQVEQAFLKDLADSYGPPSALNPTMEERVKASMSETRKFYPSHRADAWSPAPFVVLVDWSRVVGLLAGWGRKDIVLWVPGLSWSLDSRDAWIS